MTLKKIIIFALLICASDKVFSQGEETEYADLVSKRYKEFENGINKLDPRLFNNRNIGITKEVNTANQFFLENNKIKLYKKMKPLVAAYSTFVSDSKKKIELSMSFKDISDMPVFKKVNTVKKRKIYMYETRAELVVTAKDRKDSKQQSLTRNSLIMTWTVEPTGKKGREILTLTSIKASKVSGLFESEKKQAQSIAEDLIRRYYQNISKNQISGELQKTLNDDNVTTIDPIGSIDVPLPANKTFSVTGPAVVIHVDPAKYMDDDKNYLTEDAYYTISLSFDVTISDDLTSGSIIPKVTKAVSKKPEPSPEPKFMAAAPEPEPVIVIKGEHYKVQVLSISRNTAQENLPVKYRSIKNLVMEKYTIGGEPSYKYVVPVDSKIEAFRLQRQLIAQGFEDVWIVVYQDGARIRPLQGRPN